MTVVAIQNSRAAQIAQAELAYNRHAVELERQQEMLEDLERQAASLRAAVAEMRYDADQLASKVEALLGMTSAEFEANLAAAEGLARCLGAVGGTHNGVTWMR